MLHEINDAEQALRNGNFQAAVFEACGVFLQSVYSALGTTIQLQGVPERGKDSSVPTRTTTRALSDLRAAGRITPDAELKATMLLKLCAGFLERDENRTEEDARQAIETARLFASIE
ncbi:MAG: hypothetical protein ACREDR_31765 [Blastocatellia bacterium]